MGESEYKSSHRATLNEATRIAMLPRKERKKERPKLRQLATATADAQRDITKLSRAKIIISNIDNQPVKAVVRATWEVSKATFSRSLRSKRR